MSAVMSLLLNTLNMLSTFVIAFLPRRASLVTAGEVTACNAVDLGLIPGLGRSPEEEKVYPLQYAHLENSMDCILNTVTITNNHRYIRHD